MTISSIPKLDVAVDLYSAAPERVYDCRIDDSGRFCELMCDGNRQIVLDLADPASLIHDSHAQQGSYLIIESLQDGVRMMFTDQRLVRFSDNDAKSVEVLCHLRCLSHGHGRMPRCVFDGKTNSVAFVGSILLDGGCLPLCRLGILVYNIASRTLSDAYMLAESHPYETDEFRIRTVFDRPPWRGEPDPLLAVAHMHKWHDLYAVSWDYGGCCGVYGEYSFRTGSGGLAIASSASIGGSIIMPTLAYDGIVTSPRFHNRIVHGEEGQQLKGYPNGETANDFDDCQYKYVVDDIYACAGSDSLLCWHNDHGMTIFRLSDVVERQVFTSLGERVFTGKVLAVSCWQDYLVLVRVSGSCLHLKAFSISDIVLNPDVFGTSGKLQAKKGVSASSVPSVVEHMDNAARIKTVSHRVSGLWEHGWALDLHTVSSIPCGPNEVGREAFDTTRTEMGEALYQLKYRHDHTRLQGIALTMAEFVRGTPELGTVIAIIAVPPSCATRGWQPVAALAVSIGKLLNVPAPTDYVVKIKQTPQLKNISDSRTRHEELKDAFQVVDQRFAGAHVLLIDDLFRSGETLNAVAGVLLSQGKVGKVSVVTATMTRSRR